MTQYTSETITGSLVTLYYAHVEEMYEHAREANPLECCGLIGGDDSLASVTVYRLRNIAENPLTTYEAAPEDLFTAQQEMRRRREQMIGIYHSHPRSGEPRPSETDIRLAYYPNAVYFIIGLAGPEPSLGAFIINEAERTWQWIKYDIIAKKT